jgi:hypothetical protein
VQAPARIAQQVNNLWRPDTQTLPKELEKIDGRDEKDPISGKAFGYHVKSGSEYALCATRGFTPRATTASNSIVCLSPVKLFGLS